MVEMGGLWPLRRECRRRRQSLWMGLQHAFQWAAADESNFCGRGGVLRSYDAPGYGRAAGFSYMLRTPREELPEWDRSREGTDEGNDGGADEQTVPGGPRGWTYLGEKGGLGSFNDEKDGESRRQEELGAKRDWGSAKRVVGLVQGTWKKAGLAGCSGGLGWRRRAKARRALKSLLITTWRRSPRLGALAMSTSREKPGLGHVLLAMTNRTKPRALRLEQLQHLATQVRIPILVAHGRLSVN
ncbi:hypothetical protein DFH09DRAFT_1075389 [Mycena vulgaris]|nr:hypothetical protein DFH09DRAFT_1075389 [Mycena vulgaris]